jgi:hypothetical protein
MSNGSKSALPKLVHLKLINPSSDRNCSRSH